MIVPLPSFLTVALLWVQQIYGATRHYVYDRAASHSMGSGAIVYVVPRDHKFAVPTTERSSYLCGWSKHRPHKHFMLKDFPGGPLRGWSTIIYPCI